MSTTPTPDMVQAADVVRAYCDAWMDGDTMTVVSLYHDDLTLDITRALEFTVEDATLRTCRIYETDQPAIDDWLATTD